MNELDKVRNNLGKANTNLEMLQDMKKHFINDSIQVLRVKDFFPYYGGKKKARILSELGFKIRRIGMANYIIDTTENCQIISKKLVDQIQDLEVQKQQIYDQMKVDYEESRNISNSPKSE